jgi:hypothetical protein
MLKVILCQRFEEVSSSDCACQMLILLIRFNSNLLSSAHSSRGRAANSALKRKRTEASRKDVRGCHSSRLATTRHDSSHVSELEDFVLGL